MITVPDMKYRPSVLFLDDEEAILASLRSMFRREGYELFFFQDGHGAIQFLKEHPIDVIVSDMRMPVLSGIEFLNQAAIVSPEAFRIMLSGYEDKAIILKSLNKGLAHQYFLKPWNDEAFRNIIARAIEMQAELRKNEFRHIQETLGTLPSTPHFHAKLQALLTNDDMFLLQIIDEIEKSPPLVAKLLRVANSVYFAARKNITTVTDAVRFIGLEYVAGLVVAIESFHMIFMQGNTDLSESMDEVWRESVHRAELAKKVLGHWKLGNGGGAVFTAALLQDIGLVVRMCVNPVQYRRYQELSAINSLVDYDIESHIFSVTHDVLGSMLLQLWNFPETITSAIKRHHRIAGDDPVAQIIQIATVLRAGDRKVMFDPALTPKIEEMRLLLT